MPLGAGMDYWLPTAPKADSCSRSGKRFPAPHTRHCLREWGRPGGGDGSTTFNLPDKTGRVSVVKDDMGGSLGVSHHERRSRFCRRYVRRGRRIAESHIDARRDACRHHFNGTQHDHRDRRDFEQRMYGDDPEYDTRWQFRLPISRVGGTGIGLGSRQQQHRCYVQQHRRRGPRQCAARHRVQLHHTDCLDRLERKMRLDAVLRRALRNTPFP